MPILRPFLAGSTLPRVIRPSQFIRSPIQQRFESTAAANLRRPGNKLRNGVIGATTAGVVAFSYYYLTDTRSAIHKYEVVPFLRWIYNGDDVPREKGGRGDGAEKAHEIGLKALRGLYDVGLPLRERGNHEYLDTKGMDVEVRTAAEWYSYQWF